MFRVRGKTESGKSMTGTSSAETYADAAQEAEEAANAAKDPLTILSIKTLEGGAGIKIAEPRKRDGESKGKGKGKSK